MSLDQDLNIHISGWRPGCPQAVPGGRAGLVLGVLVLLAGVGGPAAAEPPPLDISSQSSVVARRVPQAIGKAPDEGRVSGKARAVKEALDQVEAALRAGPGKTPEPVVPEDGVPFFVRRVLLSPSRILTEAMWRPWVEPFEGRQQTMRAMQALADRITVEYRKRGYLSSQAYIAPQDMADGVFTVTLLEGRIGRIMFEGNRRYATAVLRRYCVIREGDLFSYQKLQDTVYRLNAHPDRVVRAIIRRGEAPGRTDIIFKVEEKSLTAANLLADNRGSKPIGQNRAGLGVRQDNLFGQDDILRMGTMMGRSFGAGFIEYALPVAKINSVWKTGVSYARSAPQKQYKPYGVNSTTMDYWSRLETRFLTTESMALDWRAGVDFKESRTMVLSGTDSRERLRILRAGPTVTLRDELGVTVVDDQLSLGVRGMGAALSDASSQRAGVTPGFFTSDLSVERMQKMPLDTRLSLKGKAHVSPDKQPASEQMALGGADTVRGYPEGEYFADQGVLVNAEYLIPFFFLPDTWRMPWAKTRLRDSLDFAVFIDHGCGWLKAPVNGQASSACLSGTGVGVRARLASHVYFTTDLAYATGARSSFTAHRFRIHSGIQASF